MRDVTCVVLAAGLATRMGRAKLALPFGEGTILDAVLAACKGFPMVVVASEAVMEAVLRLRDAPHRSAQDDIRKGFILNREPERGMTHSLRLAHRAVPPDRTIAVLLGDKPLVRAELVASLTAIDDADVAYPIRRGVPGHPVVFSPRARALIDGLPDGDTLHLLRDDPSLVRRAVEIDDQGAYVDVDTEDDYQGIVSAERRRGLEDGSLEERGNDNK